MSVFAFAEEEEEEVVAFATRPFVGPNGSRDCIFLADVVSTFLVLAVCVFVMSIDGEVVVPRSETPLEGDERRSEKCRNLWMWPTSKQVLFLARVNLATVYGHVIGASRQRDKRL